MPRQQRVSALGKVDAHQANWNLVFFVSLMEKPTGFLLFDAAMTLPIFKTLYNYIGKHFSSCTLIWAQRKASWWRRARPQAQPRTPRRCRRLLSQPLQNPGHRDFGWRCPAGVPGVAAPHPPAAGSSPWEGDNSWGTRKPLRRAVTAGPRGYPVVFALPQNQTALFKA